MDELTKKIRKLKFENGYSNKQISKQLCVNLEKVKRVTSKKYDEIIKKQEEKKKKENEFIEMVKKYLPVSNSLNNLCYNLGLRGVEGYYKKIKRVIEDNNLSTEHFGAIKLKKNGNTRNGFTAMDDDEFFSENVERTGFSIIKRLIKGNYKVYKCEKCGINEWNGCKITLQAHHLNGNHYDNRLENLQILCPNCHSQTDTYAKHNVKVNKTSTIKNNIELTNFIEKKYCEVCGKEITGSGKKYCSQECSKIGSRKFEVSGKQLIDDFRELKSFTSVGKKYGVSDNAIKKRCITLGIYDDIIIYITKR